MEYKYFLTIDKDNETNSKSPIKGTIWNTTKKHLVEKDGFIHIDDFCFNPLTIFNDIRFIQENLQLKESEKHFKSKHTALFHAPYNYEPCFDMKIEDCNVQYFYLLDMLKEIVTKDPKITRQQLEIMKLYLQIDCHYHLSIAFPKSNIYENITVETPLTFGHIHYKDIPQSFDSNFRYDCPFNTICELVFAILNYLVLYNYHFFQCQHCKRYSAIKRTQGGIKYCFCDNVIPLTEYKGMSCNKAIPKFLGSCYEKRRQIKDLFNSRKHTLKEEQIQKIIKQENDFSNQYHDFKDRVSKNPSSENLIAFRELLDNQIKKIKES